MSSDIQISLSAVQSQLWEGEKHEKTILARKGTKIHRYNFFYTLLKTYQLLVFHLFYKKVEVVGRENIPVDSPVIFTPNHQNALMDALIVLDTAGGLNPVFLTRADIFKKPLLRKILTFLKMLPVYRIRDGNEELSRNDEIFATCIDILSDSHSISIMPEGNHGYQRRLRPLVKGAFRIAFQAQEEFGDAHPVKIVPVGIDFQDYQKIRQDLLVIYGQPIEVSEYIEMHRENPPMALNALRDRLSDELKKIIIHIENEEHYAMFQDLRGLYNSSFRHPSSGLYQRFLADKEMIRVLNEKVISDPEQISRLSEIVARYMAGLQELNLRNWVIEQTGFSLFRILLQSLLLILTFPVFVAGFLTNLIPYSIPIRMSRNVKDTQFKSSVRFGLAMFIFLFYYLIVGALMAILIIPVWISLTVLGGMLISGNVALFYGFSFKKLRAALRFRALSANGDGRIIRLKELYKQIIGTMDEIMGS